MRKTLTILCIFILSAVLKSHSAEELTADKIIEKMNDIMNVDTASGKMKMTITTSSGKKRTFLYESLSKGKGEKNLMRYIEPSRAKGQAILMLNNADDIWAYFPRTRRVRKLATHAKRQKMEGSDFSYEDLGSGDAFIDEYDSELLGEEKRENYDCYKLELRKKTGSDASYSKLVLWIIKDNYVPVVIDYYDLDDENILTKELVQYDIKVIDGVPTGMKMVMYNKLDDTQTSMEIVEIKYNIDLPDELFSERNLKQ